MENVSPSAARGSHAQAREGTDAVTAGSSEAGGNLRLTVSAAAGSKREHLDVGDRLVDGDEEIIAARRCSEGRRGGEEGGGRDSGGRR